MCPTTGMFAAGLVHAMPAAVEVLQPTLLQAMHGMVLGMLQSIAQQGPQYQQQQLTTAPAAYCSLLAALTAAGFKRGWVTNEAVGNTLAALLGMLGTLVISEDGQAAVCPAGATNGRVVGAASAALGTLLPALVAQGYSPGQSSQLRQCCRWAWLRIPTLQSFMDTPLTGRS